jgi:hypothetical protein
VTAVVRAASLFCRNAGKAQKFAPVPGSYGESRIKASNRELDNINSVCNNTKSIKDLIR